MLLYELLGICPASGIGLIVNDSLLNIKGVFQLAQKGRGHVVWLQERLIAAQPPHER